MIEGTPPIIIILLMMVTGLAGFVTGWVIKEWIEYFKELRKVINNG